MSFKTTLFQALEAADNSACNGQRVVSMMLDTGTGSAAQALRRSCQRRDAVHPDAPDAIERGVDPVRDAAKNRSELDHSLCQVWTPPTISIRMAKPRKHTSSTPFVRVAPSGVHGLGAFATRALPAFALLGLYEGRRYSQQEVASRVWNDQLTYLFTLSNHETIDGAKGGNGTRHLNHACDPNCEAVEEYDDAGQLLLKLQTIVPVDAGDELFIDYCLTADDGSPPSNYPCRCGSPNCRGTMLAPVETT